MKITSLATALLAILLLAACANTSTRPLAGLYDLGPLPAQAALTALPPLSVADVSAPVALDGPRMIYRLAYANSQQLHPYADSRWSMAPAEMLGQRLKARLAAAGGVVAAAADGAAGLPLLRVELNEFSQTFEAPNASTAQVSARATLFSGRLLLAQKSFLRQLPAPSADAAGAARALADASDLLITDLMQWLTTVPLKK